MVRLLLFLRFREGEPTAIMHSLNLTIYLQGSRVEAYIRPLQT